MKGVHCFGGAPRHHGTRHDHEGASNGASKKPLDHAIGALSTGFDPADGRIGWCGFADHLEGAAARRVLTGVSTAEQELAAFRRELEL
ncbi:MAG: hypothetical protein ACRDTW_33485 [Rhodococcus qingshengii]